MVAKREKLLVGEPDECVVCSMKLSAHTRTVTREYLGDVYTFCSEACAGEFTKDPGRFEESSDEEDET